MYQLKYTCGIDVIVRDTGCTVVDQNQHELFIGSYDEAMKFVSDRGLKWIE